MKGTSHLLCGAATGLIISEKLNYNPVITVGLTVVGAILVDIDQSESTINKLIFRNNTILKSFIGCASLLFPNTLIKYIGIILLLSIVSNKVEYRFSLWSGLHQYKYHRTIFHDPIIGTILFLLPLYILSIPKIYFIPFIIGLGTHYFLDSFTNYGLPLYLLGGNNLRMPLHYNSRNTILEYLLVSAYLMLAIFIFSPGTIEVVKKIASII